MLKLITFIRENVDWEERLSKAPYHIHINRSDGLIIFSYGVEADFGIDVVRECRGIILDETDGYNPVCVPFFKFVNYGEPYADNIDWNTARVQEKIIARNENELEKIGKARFATRKELAEYVTTTVCPACLFCVSDGKSQSVRAFVKDMPADRLLKYLNIFSL